MALVSVLWSLALLTAFAMSLLFTGTVSYKLARNSLQLTYDDAVCEAAITRAILALFDPRVDRRWRVDGVAQDFNFDGAHVRLLIQDELGRIDLNHADRPLLVALFQSAGLDLPSTSSLVDKILDWRDASTRKRLSGATHRDYRDSGHVYRPRNGRFQSVDELKLVMDVTPELFKRVEPALTVYSGRQFIDPQVAPREALLALPGMNTANVDSLIRARTQQAAVGNYTLPISGGIADPINTLRGRAFTIRAQLETQDSVVTREAVVRLTGNPVQPYWILNWQRR